MESVGEVVIKKERSESSPLKSEDVHQEINSKQQTFTETLPNPRLRSSSSDPFYKNSYKVEESEEEDKHSLSSLLIPGEDEDDDDDPEFLNPFAIIPKIELDPESEQEEEEGEGIGNEESRSNPHSSTSNKLNNTSVLCLLCTKRAQPWPKSTNPNLLTSNLCNLFDIGGWREVEGEIGGKGYCKGCQHLLHNLTQLYNQLNKIRRKITSLKTELETKVIHSSGSSTTQFRNTRNNRHKGQNKEQTVRGILTERVSLKRDEPRSSEASVGQNDPDRNLPSSMCNPGSDGNAAPPEEADLPEQRTKVEDDLTYSSPPPSPEVDWHEQSSPDQAEQENNTGLYYTRKSKTSSKVNWSKSSKQGRIPSNKKPKVEEDAERNSSTEEEESSEGRRVLRNRRTSPYFPVKKKRERVKEPRPQKTVKCDLCNKMFPDDVRKNAHIRGFHEGLKDNYFCDFPDCTKHYRCLTVLENHKMSHTGETPFVCESCGKSYKLKIQLQNHQRNIHFPEGRSFKCDLCDKRYLYRSGLESHKKTHDPVREHPFICENCGQGYFTLQALNAHRRVKHSEENPFICRQDKCGKVFSSKLALKEHHYTHTKEWPFYCSICGVGSVSQSRLDRHLKRKHGETFECEICHKKMAYKESLKKHMMIHSDGKKFECDQCGKRFLDNYRLKVHQSLHVGDRIYQCDICSKRFINKPYLRRHIKNSHRKTYYQQIKDRKRQSQHLGFIDLNNSQEDDEGTSGDSSTEDHSESKDKTQGKPPVSQLLSTSSTTTNLSSSSSTTLDSAIPTHHQNNMSSNPGGGFMEPRPHPLLPPNISNLPHQPIYHQTYSSSSSTGNQLGIQSPHSFLNFHHL